MCHKQESRVQPRCPRLLLQQQSKHPDGMNLDKTPESVNKAIMTLVGGLDKISVLKSAENQVIENDRPTCGIMLLEGTTVKE